MPRISSARREQTPPLICVAVTRAAYFNDAKTGPARLRIPLFLLALAVTVSALLWAFAGAHCSFRSSRAA